ncbi:MAG: acyl--CoA ligase [Thiogranum sp.]|nr:acyl--CoA ligase [Thiogranum sp.]
MFVNLDVGVLHEPLSGRRWEPARLRLEVERRAAHYRQQQLAPGDRVFIGYGNCLEFFADLLSVWQLGATAVPVDARLTPFEIETLVRVARPRLFLHQGELEPSLAPIFEACNVSPLDTDAVPQSEAQVPVSSFTLDDDALILFTSGTTGDPKGVVHTHRSLRARWIALQQALGLESYRRTLCLLPTHFGHGLICNCLYPWLSGQELFILPPFSPQVIMRLGALIDEHEITFMSSVPSVWRLALKTARAPQKGSLKRIACGSAPLTAHLWEQIQAWGGTSEVLNTYGITETGSWVAGTTGGPFEAEDGLIGEPWGAVVAIMKSDDTAIPPGYGEPCATGETGFVWLNTPALMKGYLNRDDLTARAVSQGWFMTGDLGYLDAQGRLHLRGRTREEINKGGMKVYPADIDAVVERFAATRDMCCFGFDDPLYGQNVGVALVLEDTSADTLRELHAWMKHHLAAHQLPVKWYLLDAIPRTSRGKINRDSVAEACAAHEPVDLANMLGAGR